MKTLSACCGAETTDFYSLEGKDAHCGNTNFLICKKCKISCDVQPDLTLNEINEAKTERAKEAILKAVEESNSDQRKLVEGSGHGCMGGTGEKGETIIMCHNIEGAEKKPEKCENEYCLLNACNCKSHHLCVHGNLLHEPEPQPEKCEKEDGVTDDINRKDGLYSNEPDCGLSCGYQEPYGFVPEADCPVHDKPQPEKCEHNLKFCDTNPDIEGGYYYCKICHYVTLTKPEPQPEKCECRLATERMHLTTDHLPEQLKKPEPKQEPPVRESKKCHCDGLDCPEPQPEKCECGNHLLHQHLIEKIGEEPQCSGCLEILPKMKSLIEEHCKNFSKKGCWHTDQEVADEDFIR